MSTTGFAVNAPLTAMVMAYANPESALIADKALPLVRTTKKFAYPSLDESQGFTVQETRMGRRGAGNFVDFIGTQTLSEVLDEGLEAFMPMDEQQAWQDSPANMRPPMSPTEVYAIRIRQLVDLAREMRTANTVFAAATYPTGFKATLSGTSQWSDYTNSKPVDVIMEAMDVPLSRPNKMVISRPGWTKLRKHPQVIEAVRGTGAGAVNAAGSVSAQAFADFFDLDDVLIGEARVNTAVMGQTPSYGRAWGKHAALLYVTKDPSTAMIDQATFGFTAQWGDWVVVSGFDAQKGGLRGSMYLKVGASMREVVSAPKSGYFFQDIIA